MDEIVGRLASVTAYNGKWARASVRLADGTVVNCVGEALIGLVEGNDYKLSGRQRAHERYGVQLEVRVAQLEIPQDGNALCRYLRKNYAGCGEKTAAKFVEWAKAAPGGLDALRAQLLANPAAVDFSVVTRRAVKMSANDGPEVLIYRNLSLRLGASGIRDYLLRRLAAWLFERVGTLDDPVVSSWGRLSANPYDPIRTLDGYGFATADGIARYLSFPASHPYRLGALATHALREGCESGGHAFLTDREMEARIARHDPSVRASDAVRAAIDNGEPIVVSDEAYYPLGLYNCEVTLAAHLGRRLAGPATPITSLSRERLAYEVSVAEWSMGETFRLDASQAVAVIGLLTSTCTVHTLTAGPGCGKTALMEICVQVICAPTGKAAKVLGARVKRLGMTSATVHATLGVVADGFRYNEENPLPADIVIADEFSMNDLALTRALFDALPPGSHIILLGDRGQLASVAPGQVLSDMLELEADHRTLSTTHRNDGGILDVVEQARDGRCDCVGRPDVRFSHGLPSADATSVGRVIGVFLRAVGRCGIENVGLLMGARRGDAKVPGWNVTYMNEVLRERLNPRGKRVPGSFLKLGDRVMIRQNLCLEQGEDADGKMRFEQVVNGDTGSLVECHMDSTGHAVAHVLIELDDERHIRFPGAGLESLVLAYALSVHAAQGSEYREVIFVGTDGMPGFMHRGIVYTAFSRARERLAVFADDDVLRRVCARPIPRRNSRLVQRAIHAGASAREGRVANDSERARVDVASTTNL